MAEHYELTVNGVSHPVADAWVGENLLFVLRERLGLFGSKGACEQGECGSTCSCLVLAASMPGREITTIEGLAPAGQPTDVQQAFVDAGAIQCGFCTPGLIVATHHLLEQTPEPSEMEIREALSGNICRCTGYGRIIDAVQQVSVRRREQAAK
jgi:aerobic carbon-monoxide dehydrogenase small subunit